MAQVPIDTFLPDVMPDVIGAPVVMVQRQIKLALNDFCRQTRYLSTTLSAINVVAGTQKYALVSPATGVQIVRPEAVRYNGELLEPVGLEELDVEIPTWQTETGKPAVFTREDDDSISLIYIPETDSTGGLVVRVSYAPNLAATTFDSVLFERFGDGIAAGIKSRLLAMPGKPWTSPKDADRFEGIYRIEVSNAKQESDKTRSRARRRTKTHYR